jgi:hypothetical protein
MFVLLIRRDQKASTGKATHGLERIAFNRIHVFIGPGEAAFAKHNAFARSGEFN